jgi:hypothetical protein
VPDQPGQQEELPQHLTSIPAAKGTKAKMQTAPTRWEIREPALAVGTAGSYTILVNRLRKARKAAPHQPGVVLSEAEPIKVWAKAELNTKGKVKLAIKRWPKVQPVRAALPPPGKVEQPAVRAELNTKGKVKLAIKR